MVKELKHKPLVEAILEVRWKLQGQPSGPQIDPHYKLLLGRLFDRFLHDYPEHEQLPTASIPDEMAGHVVQHRFRVAQNSWPLVQVGPGIFSVNSTADYTWPDFRARALTAIGKLFDAHPKSGEFKITNLILRYIDAVDFDSKIENVFSYLNHNLKVNVSLPDSLFGNIGGVEKRPTNFTWQGSFESVTPKGLISIRFATGSKELTPALVWETMVESAGVDLPAMPDSFEDWFDAAHTLSDDWFFKMIEGELERRFSGE
jgi:uncharacterized protein (TIGR04255 family)